MDKRLFDVFKITYRIDNMRTATETITGIQEGCRSGSYEVHEISMRDYSISVHLITHLDFFEVVNILCSRH